MAINAEQAGRLAEVGRTTLPAHVFAGGVQQAVEQRLKRIPDNARLLLSLAAVSGRFLDLNLLRAVNTELDLDEWSKQPGEPHLEDRKHTVPLRPSAAAVPENSPRRGPRPRASAETHRHPGARE